MKRERVREGKGESGRERESKRELEGERFIMFWRKRD